MNAAEQAPPTVPDWLKRHSREEWMELGLQELGRAEQALAGRDTAAAIPGLKRAAGMALNAALRRVWRVDWGRTYVEHLEALSRDSNAPEPVRAAAELLSAAQPAGQLVMIGSRSRDDRLREAARTVMAHAYALAFGSTGEPGAGGEDGADGRT